MYAGVNDANQGLTKAATLLQQGRIAEAAQIYEVFLRKNPRQFDALYNLGLIHLRQQRFSEAVSLFRQAAKIERKSATVQHLLAIALSESGALEDAVEHYGKAIALQPDYADAHKNLGYVLLSLGRPEKAAQHCKKALAIKPGDTETQTTLANALHALKRYPEAAEQYREVLALRPDSPEAHRNLAVALSAQDRHEEAVAYCERALALSPRYSEAHLTLANAYAGLGQKDSAIAQYEKLLALEPNHAKARRSIAQMLFLSGQPESAMAHFDQVLASNPQDVEALNLGGNVLRALGKIGPAIAAFEKAIAAAPRDGAGYFNLTQSRRVSADDQYFAAMKKLAGDEGQPVQSQINLHFGLAKIHDELGDHKQAFRHLLRANHLKRRQLDYQENEALDYFKAIEKVFTPAIFAEHRGSGNPSPLPIFVIGMPRSGTTLIEQILASHPKVFGAGESYEFGALAGILKGSDGSVFPEVVPSLSAADFRNLGTHYLDAIRNLAPNAERITDKMPANFFNTGLIHLALPNARIIHVRRDPRDLAVSCFSTVFGRGQYFSYDLVELGRYIRAYLKLMAHWCAVLPAGAMLEIDYEEVVGDLQGSARRIIDYCGLEWDDAVLSFHATQRVVTTVSVVQVRQPIYSSSLGRWRFYEKQLQPLLDILQAPDEQ